MDRIWRIYRATCSVTNKSYIGQTVNAAQRRWNDHISAAARGSTLPFHRAIQEYGSGSFRFEVICETASLEEASTMERSLIASHGTISPNGYNVAKGGQGTLGVRRPHSEETKRKIAEGNRGKVMSEKSRILMGTAKRGKPLSIEHRAKLSFARKGMKRTAEHRKHISDAHRGRKFIARSISLLGNALLDPNPMRGVIPDGKKWSARVTMNGRRVHIGNFDTIEEAAAAYRAAVRRRIAELSSEQ